MASGAEFRPSVQSDYLNTNSAPFTPISVRLGKTALNVAGTIINHTPDGRWFSRPVEIVTKVGLCVGLVAVIPVIVIETLATGPISFLAEKLRGQIKSEFFLKYARKCHAYAGQSIAELAVIYFVFSNSLRTYPILTINVLFHSSIFLANHSLATAHFPDSSMEQVNSRRRGFEYLDLGKEPFFDIISDRTLKQVLTQSFNSLGIQESEHSALERELIEIFNNNLQFSGWQPGPEFFKPFQKRGIAFNNYLEYFQILVLIQIIRSRQELRQKLASTGGTMEQVFNDVASIDTESFRLELLFLLKLAEEHGADFLKELTSAINSDHIGIEAQFPQDFLERHREEINSFLERPNLIEFEPRAKAIKLCLSLLLELGILKKPIPRGEVYYVNHTYRSHCYDLLKKSIIEIYKNDCLVKELAYDTDPERGRRNIKSFDTDTRRHIACFMRLKELESEKGILCPEAWSIQRQDLIETKAKLVELEKVPGAKNKLVQKLLNPFSRQLDNKVEAIYDRIVILAGNVERDLQSVYQIHPFTQPINLNYIFRVKDLFQRAHQEALAELIPQSETSDISTNRRVRSILDHINTKEPASNLG